MCQKQCRDEKGFKCHCMSESHQRQMQIFGQNAHRIVEGYSEEFENSFLDLMRRAHRFSDAHHSAASPPPSSKTSTSTTATMST
ncbi:hypothetical protein MLD38_026577 [Melastoma candidum]|uniref:Uncharacterized protein n=1 Tax=Melastoma candidum TaxID=119954 RepID=A0ACB9NZ24_9MYRT|nr:hypothetical protein MLD38_026577 [Melastoma candidum]